MRNLYGGPDALNTELQRVWDKLQIGPMKAAIDGAAGQLYQAEVSEVWKDGEVAVTFRRPGDGAERVLLKGADTTFVADGFRFSSDRIWMVTGKQTYATVGGVERSILVAEPLDLSPYINITQFGIKQVDARTPGNLWSASCMKEYSRIVQILGKNEMLVTMRVLAGFPTSKVGVVLLRGVDTTALTEDARPPFGQYTITGTYRYKGTNDSMNTVFVAERK